MDNKTPEYHSVDDAFGNSKQDVYTELMKKEENVLNTANRIVDMSQRNTMNESLFYNQSILEVVVKFANTWHNIFSELVNEHMYKYPEMVFWKEDRKIYVGMMLVLIGLFLFFIENSS